MAQLRDLLHIEAKLSDVELRKAVRKLRPDERREQMVSWMMSTIPHDSTTTREDVVRFLDDNPW